MSKAPAVRAAPRHRAGARAASPSLPAPGRSHLGGRTLQLPVGTRRLRAPGCASRAGLRGAGSCGAELGDKNGFWLGLAKAPGALLEPRGCGRHARLSEPGAEQGCWGVGSPTATEPRPRWASGCKPRARRGRSGLQAMLRAGSSTDVHGAPPVAPRSLCPELELAAPGEWGHPSGDVLRLRGRRGAG